MSEPRWVDSSSIGTGYMLKEGVRPDKPLIVMLHGWSGDERVMWVFESVLPEDWWIASPRGLYPLRGGGYNWLPGTASYRHQLSDFKEGAAVIQGLVCELVDHYALSPLKLILMGFSQGAGLAFSTAELAAFRPAGLVSLAGFLPEGELTQLANVPIFWGHGLRDKRVPIETAREAVQRLQETEAEVHFCEADVGHKVGVDCARGLKSWLNSVE